MAQKRRHTRNKRKEEGDKQGEIEVGIDDQPLKKNTIKIKASGKKKLIGDEEVINIHIQANNTISAPRYTSKVRRDSRTLWKMRREERQRQVTKKRDIDDRTDRLRSSAKARNVAIQSYL